MSLRVTIIAAVSKNGVIGREGVLPWHIPRDLHFFSTMTRHKAVIMGHKTFKSLAGPLVERYNIVLTRNLHNEDKKSLYEVHKNLIFTDSITHALALATRQNESLRDKEVMIIGGGEIYAQFIGISDKLLISHIGLSVGGDVYFPSFALKEWQRRILSKHDDSDISFHIVEYTRSRPPLSDPISH